jgi:hypothetical protein
MSRPAALLVAFLSLPAFASGMTPSERAKIQREQQEAQDAVAKKYGNRKLSEMSNAERSAMAREQAEAQQKVLDRNGVTQKDWAVSSMRMGRAEKAETEAAARALEADAKRKQKGGPAAGKGNGEIQIQRGFGNDKPAVLEDKGGGEPEIEIQRGPTGK